MYMTAKGKNPEVCEMNIDRVTKQSFQEIHLSRMICNMQPRGHLSILSYYVFLYKMDFGKSLQLLMKLAATASTLNSNRDY